MKLGFASQQTTQAAVALRRMWWRELYPSVTDAPELEDLLDYAYAQVQPDLQLSIRAPKLTGADADRVAAFRQTVRSRSMASAPCLTGVRLTLAGSLQLHPRRQPSAGDVAHPGDPHPDSWAALTVGLLPALAADTDFGALFAGLRVAALSSSVVWLGAVDEEQFSAVTLTPGARWRLRQIVEKWNPGMTEALLEEPLGRT